MRCAVEWRPREFPSAYEAIRAPPRWGRCEGRQSASKDQHGLYCCVGFAGRIPSEFFEKFCAAGAEYEGEFRLSATKQRRFINRRPLLVGLDGGALPILGAALCGVLFPQD